MKKSIKITVIIIALLIVVIAGVMICALKAKQSSSASVTDTADTVVLTSGQSLTTAKLTSVIGNEITYVVVEETEIVMENPRGNAEESSTTGTTYTETEETGEFQIPVGTDVITKLGTSTTFARLASGDIIKMLIQDGEVIKIWIIQ